MNGACMRSVGIVVAILKNPQTSAIENIVVCSAALGGRKSGPVTLRNGGRYDHSTITNKGISPIWVEYLFSKDGLAIPPEQVSCGDIVEGVGAIQYICEKYLQVVPVGALQVSRFDRAKHEKAYKKLSGSQRFAIRAFTKKCLYWNKWLDHAFYDLSVEDFHFTYFSRLYSETHDGTLAHIEAKGMLLSEVRIRGMKRQFWLLASAFPRHKYVPLLVCCKTKGVHTHEYGSVFSLVIPVFSMVSDSGGILGYNLPVCFVGGHAQSTFVPNSDEDNIGIYHALHNVMYAPKNMSTLLFPKKSDRGCAHAHWMALTESLAKKETLGNTVHGWWGQGYWDMPWGIHATEKLGIQLIYTDYKDGGPNRVLIVKRDKGDFRDTANVRSCTVTIAESPQLHEGPYVPTKKEWQYICEWVRLNREVLSNEKLYDSDYHSKIRYVGGYRRRFTADEIST